MSASQGIRARALAPLLLALACAGCCAGPELAMSAFDPRAAIEARTTYALLAPQLEAPVWAYASSAAVASSVAAHYDPEPGAALPLGALAEAPPALQATLEAVDARLRALGYVPAAAPPADFVVSLGLTTDATQALVRLSLNLGGELDGRFRPDLLGLEARVPVDDPCPVSAAELADALCAVIPARDPEAE